MKSTTDVVPAIYKPGERFAQLIIMPIPTFTIVETSDLTQTDRGEGGFGSTNNSAATVPQESTDGESVPTEPDTEQATDTTVSEEVA